MRTLVVTNDFPPRPGGIQAFVARARRAPARRTRSSSTRRPGGARRRSTRAQPFPVVRHPDVAHAAGAGRAAPRPRGRRAPRAATGCGSARRRRSACSRGRSGLARAVASTHGHEVGWALLPGARQVLRRIGRDVDVVTYLGDYTRRRLAPALGPHARARAAAERGGHRGVPPGRRRRRRSGGGTGWRTGRSSSASPGWCRARARTCSSRALPELRAAGARHRAAARRRRPGPPRLRRLAAEHGVARRRRARPARVPWEELPAHYDAGDVFAMPCRTRRGGLEVEGLGIVFLEASATGLPVVAGRSGGSPDAVLEGETGTRRRRHRVRPRSPTRWPTCSPTRSGRGRWARPAGRGSSGSGAGTCSPAGCAACSPGTGGLAARATASPTRARTPGSSQRRSERCSASPAAAVTGRPEQQRQPARGRSAPAVLSTRPVSVTGTASRRLASGQRAGRRDRVARPVQVGAVRASAATCARAAAPRPRPCRRRPTDADGGELGATSARPGCATRRRPPPATTAPSTVSVSTRHLARGDQGRRVAAARRATARPGRRGRRR